MLCLCVIAVFAFFFFLDWVSSRLRGDCDLQLNTGAILNAYKLQKSEEIRLSFDVLLENKSLKEQALVIYAHAHFVPSPWDQVPLTIVNGTWSQTTTLQPKWIRITLAQNPREDGYFEATLVKPGKSMPLRIQILLEGLKDKELTLEVSFSYYGRKPMTTSYVRFPVPLEAFQEGIPLESPSPPKIHTPRKPGVFPISTHLIFPGEDLGRVIAQYTQGKFKPGDWVAIAESVVAIAQGRVYPVDSIHPGFWAQRLNRFFKFDSSMASCYSMQRAIEEVGLPRIMLGTAIGLVGRLLGRSGDFYRIAGRAVATIDDCTGTLPPFDKSVVMGPKDADQVALEIQKKTGYEAAIVDANDLGKVDILGQTKGIVARELVEALIDNPQGNADEQTPIVMIRK